MGTATTESGLSLARVFASVKGLHARVHIGRTWHAAPFAAVGAVVAKRGVPTLGESTLLAFCLLFGRGLVVSLHRALGAPEEVANPALPGEPSGAPRAIWWAFALHAALGLGFCAWILNPVAGGLAVTLSFVLFAAAALRRRTALSHVLLGAGLAAAAPGAFVALHGAFDARLYGTAMFGLGVLLWAVGLDVLWSLQPRLRAPGAPGGFPYPMSVGRVEARTLARVAQCAALVFFTSARETLGLDRWYFLGVAAAGACLAVAFARQRAEDASDVSRAFLRWNLAVGPCLFAGVIAGL